MNKAYKYVGGLRPSRSLFNNSHSKLFDMDFGELIPVLGMEMLPGQSTEISLETIIRMQPLVAPVLHEINAYVHFFYVPIRLLMNDKDHGFETFLTGGVSGEETVYLPRWHFIDEGGNASALYKNEKYSLADYFDIPIYEFDSVSDASADLPLGFNQRAYNFIYNEYYSDQNFMGEISAYNNDILYRCWEKDYFTSSLPNQQRGVAPALPISGILPIDFFGGGNMSSLKYPDDSTKSSNSLQDYDGLGVPASGSILESWLTNVYLKANDDNSQLRLLGSIADIETGSKQNVSFTGQPITASVDMSDAITFNVSDLRLAFQVQKFLERNMRAGARYTEFLQAHFGVSPSDSRLQRPEYVGGCKSHVVISEVLQNSASVDGSTPQGNLAGKGLVADFNKITRFTSPEFGVLIGIMSIMPRSMYCQGLDRQYSRYTRYDWPMPEFAHLSEQAVLTKEIFFSNNSATNNTIFGYQGIFNELRSSQSKVCGGMRDTFNYWHLARVFENAPVMNADFLTCNPDRDGLKRIFAVQDEKSFIVNLGFNIRNTVPLPEFPEPGLIDHF